MGAGGALRFLVADAILLVAKGARKGLQMEREGMIGVPELALRCKVSADYIRQCIEKGLIPGAFKVGWIWIIPESGAGAFIARRQQRELFRIRRKKGEIPDQPGKLGA
jgi:hypothetical protein